MDLQIRNATEADLPTIVDIYNQSIPAGWSTADTQPITVADRVTWFRKFDPARRPIWVAESDGNVVGMTYLSSFYGGRPAYDATAEVSVYVATAHHQRGIGRRLKEFVIEQCPHLGVTTLLSMHFDHNEATRRINERLGFEQMGNLTEIALVHGQQRGLVIWGLRIPQKASLANSDSRRSMSASLAAIRSAYDIACEAYARKFINELDHKPLDRELLKRFASLVAAGGSVLDLGCGPGHTTAHLTSLGLDVTGVDLSSNMVENASKFFPQSNFVMGDFLELPHESSSIAGILAFYCIVHLAPDQLVRAFSEMFRVLRGGGVLLLSFHAGSKVVRAENFLDTNAVLDFTFFEPQEVSAALVTAGFDLLDVRLREPYVTEHPSRRCYIFAQKAQQTE